MRKWVDNVGRHERVFVHDMGKRNQLSDDEFERADAVVERVRGSVYVIRKARYAEFGPGAGEFSTLDSALEYLRSDA